MERHQLIRSAIRNAGSGFVSVRFVKKDGTERQLVFNPRDCSGIKGTGKTSSPTKNPNIITVRECLRKQWRSFDSTRVLSLKVNGQVTSFEGVS